MGRHERSSSAPIPPSQSTSPPISPRHHGRDSKRETPKSPKLAQRKSWFSRTILSRPKSKTSQVNDKDIKEPEVSGGQDRYRPLQFAPSRMATLYVTPSERNLYLAAMAQLDESPPPLPLWSEPSPTIPPLTQQAPFEAQMPIQHRQPVSSLIGSQLSPHPMATRAMSPKLVTSPGAMNNLTGLQVRDEFRLNRVPPRSTRHALLSLVPPASLRFTGFPNGALMAADEAVTESWPMGVTSRSEGRENIRQRAEGKEGKLWKVELEGRAWKRKGHQELDSIRLLLSVLTALGVHGWVIVDSVQAGGSKKNSHNLLFSYSSEVFSVPPLFFALSFPLPDRISIICPPAKSTPAILSAVRNAIITSSPFTSHNADTASLNTQRARAISADGSVNRITWNGDERKGIKLEGWVHPGVYRFWIGGMRRWIVGAVKRKTVDSLHPNLVLGIINNISALHMSLIASVPLLPLAKGRDLLIFSSLSSSGLSYRDAYKSMPPEPSTGSSSGSESPVMVSPVVAPSRLTNASHNRRQAVLLESGRTSPDKESRGRDVVGVDENGRRVLPWTSVVDNGQNDAPLPPTTPGTNQLPPPLPPRNHVRSGSMPSPSHHHPSNATTHRRVPSEDSTRPLIPASSQSSPRPRNVLLKKGSLKRKESKRASANSLRPGAGENLDPAIGQPEPGSMYDHDAPLVSHPVPERGTAPTPEQWSIVDVPTNIGHLGVSMYDPGQSAAATHDTENSTYQDAGPLHENEAAVPMIPQSRASNLPLGQRFPVDASTPAQDDDQGQLETLQSPEGYGGLPIREGISPRRGQLVNMHSHDMLASMHGSVGYAGAPSMMSGVSGHGDPSVLSGLSGHDARQRKTSGFDLAPPLPPRPAELGGVGGPGEHGELMRARPQEETTSAPGATVPPPAQPIPVPMHPSETAPDMVPGGWRDGTTTNADAVQSPAESTDEDVKPEKKSKRGFFGRVMGRSKSSKNEDSSAPLIADQQSPEKGPIVNMPTSKPSAAIDSEDNTDEDNAGLDSKRDQGKGKALTSSSRTAKSDSLYESAQSEMGQAGSGPGAAGSARTRISVGR